MTTTTNAFADLQRANARIQYLEQENQTLRRQLRWEDELFAHPDLTPGQKITLRSLYEPMINGTQGLEHIEIWKIAQQTGQSDKTVGKTIQFFNDHGILRRDVQHDRLTQKTQVSIEVAEPVLHPKRIQLPERPKSGYHPPKQKCPACGGELDIETAVSCKCGLKHTVSIRPATKHDTELVEKFTKLARLDKQLSESGGQFVGRPPLDENTLVEGSIEPLSEAVDNLSGTPLQEVAEKVSDRIHILQSEESSIAFPHTPPTQEDLFAAAKLLLDIAGPGQEHVEMSREGPAKYFTVHRPLRLDDMHRHLRGSRTKGATLQHPDGLTRAIVDDADTPQDWERLQEAAILLAAAGFKPILEPSPVQDGDHVGGGHLWIIFDAFVEAYAARRTLCYYAPMLAESREYWPNAGNRIRLPGGRYIRPGFEAWCSLYDAAGNELSHDGPGAAQMLLQYQSPVDLLLVVQKPTPQKALPPARKRPPAGEQQGLSLVKQVIADFNDSHSWEEIAGLCGGFDRSKKFAAIWRGDQTPNVSVDPKTDRAKDFSSNAWLPGTMDQYQVWCLIQGGLGWEEFRRRDLAQRCRELERQAEPPKQEPQEQGALILSAERGQEPKSIAAQVNNSEIVALAEELGAMICDACTRCGCPLHWDRQGEPFCCRCYPKPRAGWSDDAWRRLRALPRKVVI